MTTVNTNDPFADALPEILRSHREALGAALARPVPGIPWPEDHHYQDAEQPDALGAVLVAAIHHDLTSARIGYVFRKRMGRRDKTTLATASKAGPKLEHFAGLDFLIQVNWEAWGALTAVQRVALIDHELCHCARADTGDWTLLSHDVEEFGSIVQRWGLWTPDLATFSRVLSDQPSLFAVADAAKRVASMQATVTIMRGGATNGLLH